LNCAELSAILYYGVFVPICGFNLPLQKRLDLEEQLAILEPKRTQLRKQIFDKQDKINLEHNRLIEETEKKLTQRVEISIFLR